jgi:hypothetical protein
MRFHASRRVTNPPQAASLHHKAGQCKNGIAARFALSALIGG